MRRNIFVNYRVQREGGWHAEAIRGKLASEFGEERVFMDVHTLRPADDWMKVIRAEIGNAAALMVIMVEDWHKVHEEPSGDRRITRDDDWVREEIRTALQAAIPIFLILIDDAKLPNRKWLPLDIQPMLDRQATTVRRVTADTDLEPVFAELSKLPSIVRRQPRLGGHLPESRPALPALDLGSIHRFDLHAVMEECLPRIESSTGLIGFILHSPCDRLVSCLIERVKEHWHAVEAPRTRQINTIGGLKVVPRAIAQIQKLRKALAEHDVVCSAVVVDESAAAELWQGAMAELVPTAKRFVLFVFVHEPASTPSGMFSLPAPVFLSHHAVGWWRDVIRAYGWRSSLIEDVLRGFTGGARDSTPGPLDMDGVYDDLSDAIELLKEHRNEDLFLAAWSRTKGIR